MPNRLTVYELELMDVLWELGEGTVQDVADSHGRELAYTTVMTSLNILHSKKHVVTRKKQGRAFVYRPNVSREQMSKIVLDELKPILFKNSLPSLLLSLFSPETLGENDIDVLKDAIEKIEQSSRLKQKV